MEETQPVVLVATQEEQDCTRPVLQVLLDALDADDTPLASLEAQAAAGNCAPHGWWWDRFSGLLPSDGSPWVILRLALTPCSLDMDPQTTRRIINARRLYKLQLVQDAYKRDIEQVCRCLVMALHEYALAMQQRLAAMEQGAALGPPATLACYEQLQHVMQLVLVMQPWLLLTDGAALLKAAIPLSFQGPVLSALKSLVDTRGPDQEIERLAILRALFNTSEQPGCGLLANILLTLQHGETYSTCETAMELLRDAARLASDDLAAAFLPQPGAPDNLTKLLAVVLRFAARFTHDADAMVASLQPQQATSMVHGLLTTLLHLMECKPSTAGGAAVTAEAQQAADRCQADLLAALPVEQLSATLGLLLHACLLEGLPESGAATSDCTTTMTPLTWRGPRVRSPCRDDMSMEGRFLVPTSAGTSVRRTGRLLTVLLRVIACILRVSSMHQGLQLERVVWMSNALPLACCLALRLHPLCNPLHAAAADTVIDLLCCGSGPLLGRVLLEQGLLDQLASLPQELPSKDPARPLRPTYFGALARVVSCIEGQLPAALTATLNVPIRRMSDPGDDMMQCSTPLESLAMRPTSTSCPGAMPAPVTSNTPASVLGTLCMVKATRLSSDTHLDIRAVSATESQLQMPLSAPLPNVSDLEAQVTSPAAVATTTATASTALGTQSAVAPMAGSVSLECQKQQVAVLRACVGTREFVLGQAVQKYAGSWQQLQALTVAVRQASINTRQHWAAGSPDDLPHSTENAEEMAAPVEFIPMVTSMDNSSSSPYTFSLDELDTLPGGDPVWGPDDTYDASYLDSCGEVQAHILQEEAAQQLQQLHQQQQQQQQQQQEQEAAGQKVQVLDLGATPPAYVPVYTASIGAPAQAQADLQPVVAANTMEAATAAASTVELPMGSSSNSGSPTSCLIGSPGGAGTLAASSSPDSSSSINNIHGGSPAATGHNSGGWQSFVPSNGTMLGSPVICTPHSLDDIDVDAVGDSPDLLAAGGVFYSTVPPECDEEWEACEPEGRGDMVVSVWQGTALSPMQTQPAEPQHSLAGLPASLAGSPATGSSAGTEIGSPAGASAGSPAAAPSPPRSSQGGRISWGGEVIGTGSPAGAVAASSLHVRPPQVSPPQLNAPQVSPPHAFALHVSPPQTTAPQVNPVDVNHSRRTSWGGAVVPTWQCSPLNAQSPPGTASAPVPSTQLGDSNGLLPVALNMAAYATSDGGGGPAATVVDGGAGSAGAGVGLGYGGIMATVPPRRSSGSSGPSSAGALGLPSSSSVAAVIAAAAAASTSPSAGGGSSGARSVLGPHSMVHSPSHQLLRSFSGSLTVPFTYPAAPDDDDTGPSFPVGPADMEMSLASTLRKLSPGHYSPGRGMPFMLSRSTSPGLGDGLSTNHQRLQSPGQQHLSPGYHSPGLQQHSTAKHSPGKVSAGSGRATSAPPTLDCFLDTGSSDMLGSGSTLMDAAVLVGVTLPGSTTTTTNHCHSHGSPGAHRASTSKHMTLSGTGTTAVGVTSVRQRDADMMDAVMMEEQGGAMTRAGT